MHKIIKKTFPPIYHLNKHLLINNLIAAQIPQLFNSRGLAVDKRNLSDECKHFWQVSG
ncbi:hypothetical protein SAMN05421820_10453 [Pedobacter steynii]|uniref:Uncharacterized protein n=1 Tax=Pedobacter steynii TaxID=430522 RepID=A0A1G9U4U1_9SPHI|nr:hypothetical protein SAMN05421820_10453 [Pedobacter steynii]